MLNISLDTTDYVIKQLSKMHNKCYQSYVVHRIINLLDDLSLKFVIHQYVRHSDKKITLMDIYFPQLDLHVEVEEGDCCIKNSCLEQVFYFNHSHYNSILFQTKQYMAKDVDIINIVGHRLLKINTSRDESFEVHDLEDIHQQIDIVIEKIRYEKSLLLNNEMFKPWDIHSEYQPETYIELGEICLEDHVVLNSREDVYKCFGLSYSAEQQYAQHPFEDNTTIWFARLYEYKGWMREISADGLMITEKLLDQTMPIQECVEWGTQGQKRIVFSRVRDNLTQQTVYRFMGLFIFESKNNETGINWHRISSSVKTYPLEPAY